MAKKSAAKKPTISKKKQVKKIQKILLPTGEMVEQEYPDQFPAVPTHAPVIPDPEAVLAEVKDAAAALKYPPPRKNKIFREKWCRFIDNVTSRPNFKPGHLDVLEILCDLYVELEDLNAFIRMHGRTYKSTSRVGETWKPYPQAAQIDRTRALIQQYTKSLDLFPKRDTKVSSGSAADAEEWS